MLNLISLKSFFTILGRSVANVYVGSDGTASEAKWWWGFLLLSQPYSKASNASINPSNRAQPIFQNALSRGFMPNGARAST